MAVARGLLQLVLVVCIVDVGVGGWLHPGYVGGGDVVGEVLGTQAHTGGP